VACRLEVEELEVVWVARVLVLLTVMLPLVTVEALVDAEVFDAEVFGAGVVVVFGKKATWSTEMGQAPLESLAP